MIRNGIVRRDPRESLDGMREHIEVIVFELGALGAVRIIDRYVSNGVSVVRRLPVQMLVPLPIIDP